MNVNGLIGLAGVVAAVSFAELNDQVTAIALPDISGGLGISQDPASWLTSLYGTGLVLGMCTGPSLAVSFSTRYFLLFAIAMTCAVGLLVPVVDTLPLIYLLRFLQGLGEGFIISNLIAVALKVLEPSIRLYGLTVYAMTATLIPSLAATLAALWVDVVGDWRFIFIESVPFAAISAVLVWYGMEQEPLNFERLKKFDWKGTLLVALGFGSFSTVMIEGDRYDWFHSLGITLGVVVSVVAIPLFLYVETHVEVPLMKLSLLKRRNYAYAGIALVTFLIISLSASQVPLAYLQQTQGYRPLQSQPITLEIALAQLVLLPATAWLLDFEWVDSRIVSAVGLLFILAACACGTQLNSLWNRDQFIPQQALQAIGEPLVIVPLLMMATNELAPAEGPFGSALINTPRAVAESLGFGVLTLIARFRGTLHRDRILDELGQNRVALVETYHLPSSLGSPVDSPNTPTARALQALNGLVRQQVAALTTIDAFIILGALTIFLMVVLATVPVRTYPPRIALAKK
jgi:DHA2 family multidrug resistance protein